MHKSKFLVVYLHGILLTIFSFTQVAYSLFYIVSNWNIGKIWTYRKKSHSVPPNGLNSSSNSPWQILPPVAIKPAPRWGAPPAGRSPSDTGSTGWTWRWRASLRPAASRWQGWPGSCTPRLPGRTSRTCWRGWRRPAGRPAAEWGDLESSRWRRLLTNQDQSLWAKEEEPSALVVQL